jgi:ADP-ribosylglycohydrolase
MSLPADHTERLHRMEQSIVGLSIGDSFGEQFFVSESEVEGLIAKHVVPAAPWRYTDDTVMALAIHEVIYRHGHIDQDELALVFARRYAADPRRGYAGTAHETLRAISEGQSWRDASRRAFGGAGSMGNGGAMRVAPLGAYFAGDDEAVVREARLSAEVTHAHADAQAGAIAVAVAAAWSWETRERRSSPTTRREMFDKVIDLTPEGETRRGLKRARNLPDPTSVSAAAAALGSGKRVVSWDTVPFALWCAGGTLHSFEEAMWTTVAGLGDRDTTCAIVGGIVALATGVEGIPTDWLEAREPLV